MKIGVVSDTHNNLVNVRMIVKIFNEEGVDRVVHTGDITKGTTLDLFGELEMPLFGVFGNNDVERESLDQVIEHRGFHFGEHYLNVNWHNSQIVIVHDPRELDSMQLEYDLALQGHTHLYRADRTDNGSLIFNPGECAGHVKGLNAIGIVNLDQLETSIVNF